MGGPAQPHRPEPVLAATDVSGEDGATIGVGVDAPNFAVPGFDAVARMVAGSLRASLVALVLVDGSSFWYAPGDTNELRRGLQPLLHDAAERREAHTIPDVSAHVDESQAHVGALSTAVRFFASEPVVTLSGTHAGALCVMDVVPRRGLDEEDARVLRDGASLIGNGLVLRSYLGRTDPVTQLPNRMAFFEDLHEHLDDDSEGSVPLAAIDIAPVERFNAFIRAMGHSYSDALMRRVAARIQAWMWPGQRLYQVGPSRFAIVFDDAGPLGDVTALDTLVTSLREPIDCESIPLSLQPGVGLLHVDLAELRRGDPLRRVMSAAHAALNSPRGWCHYRADADDHHRQEFFLVTELSSALGEKGGHDGSELELHYQPRVDLDSGRCIAVEALARWRHPSLGYISPGQFVPLAERAALMRVLTDWVFESAIAQLGRWLRAGRDIRLSMNVSSNDCQVGLVQRLERVARRHDVSLEYIELEFTESTFLHQVSGAGERIGELRERGIGVAIDDFGTGYSNLAYLRQIPATTLKIDQSFVRSIMDSPEDATIVSSIARMARKLGFRVVVEGVETESIFNAVRAMECDEVQGYFLARPMPPASLEQWLDDHAAAPLPGRG